MSNPKIDKNGNKIWRNEKGDFHREDGPAIECANGNKGWFKNGKYHRTDGPAFEKPNGYKEYFLNGIRYDSLGALLMAVALE